MDGNGKIALALVESMAVNAFLKLSGTLGSHLSKPAVRWWSSHRGPDFLIFVDRMHRGGSCRQVAENVVEIDIWKIDHLCGAQRHRRASGRLTGLLGPKTLINDLLLQINEPCWDPREFQKPHGSWGGCMCAFGTHLVYQAPYASHNNDVTCIIARRNLLAFWSAERYIHRLQAHSVEC